LQTWNAFFVIYRKNIIMESKNIELTDALNKLVQVNEGRMEGYENALDKCKQDIDDLRGTFSQISIEARKHIETLKQKIVHLQADLQGNNAVSDKISSLFRDLKWVFAGKSREAVLETCADLESEALKAYDKVLTSDVEMSADTREGIIQQKENIQKALDQMHSLRKEFAA
jgi:uncharacterized protein (TIGR02284 family)